MRVRAKSDLIASIAFSKWVILSADTNCLHEIQPLFHEKTFAAPPPIFFPELLNTSLPEQVEFTQVSWRWFTCCHVRMEFWSCDDRWSYTRGSWSKMIFDIGCECPPWSYLLLVNNIWPLPRWCCEWVCSGIHTQLMLLVSVVHSVSCPWLLNSFVHFLIYYYCKSPKLKQIITTWLHNDQKRLTDKRNELLTPMFSWPIHPNLGPIHFTI